MPLIDGRFTDPILPSAKHAEVIYSPGKYVDGKLIPWRERWLYGGRNGYKDWSFAAAAIEIGVRTSRRFLFTREVQLTIKDSAHQLLKDTIKRLGYDKYFYATNNEIRTTDEHRYKNGVDTSIIFRGLNDLVSGDVKSTEGIDVAVLCEAQNLTEKSWIDFNPTIRKPGSEIWGMFNTQFDTDFVYQHVVECPHDRLIAEKVNYTDAPRHFMSEEIRFQAEDMKLKNPAMYNNVWLGLPRTIGLHFTEFGIHNRCVPFIIPEQDDNLRIFGSLDHGIAHNTSFGLWWLSPDGKIYRIFTYSRNGGTTRSHAEAIVEVIESCRLSRYLFPCEVYYDYAMDTKHRLNEQVYRSDLDEYKDFFASREGGKDTLFIPANKRKVDGCHIMQQVFSVGNGEPVFQYFDQLNDQFVESIKRMVSDEVEPEMYAKMDGDDEADEARYGIMGIVAKSAAIRSVKKRSEKTKQIDITPVVECHNYGGLT